MSFERASVLVDPQEISQLAVAFTRFGDDNDRVTLNSFQKNFVRPSKSSLISKRIFSLICNKPLAAIENDSDIHIDFKTFLPVFVSFSRADSKDKFQISFELFSDCNSKNYISKSSFVATWSAAASLAHTLHFKLIAFEDLKSNAIVDIKQFETIGNDVFEKFAQRRNDQMTLDEFRVWAEDGNCELIGFLTYSLEKTLNPDYILPDTHTLRSLQSCEAQMINNQNSEILTRDELTSIGAALPMSIAPPKSAFELIYSTQKHGYSLATMIAAHDRRRKNGSNKLLDDGMLIVVKSQENDVFGVWTSIPLKFREEPYGDSLQTFLFKRIDEDNFAIYKTREETSKHCLYYVDDLDIGGVQGVGIGGSLGFFGLFLDRGLVNGSSKEVTTFYNQPLCANDDGKFDIAAVECYAIAQPIDVTKEPLVGDKDDKGILETYQDQMFILDLIGKGHSRER